MDAPTPQLVASTFVDQYYTILCNSPEHLKRFYDSDNDGGTTTHSTLSDDHVLLSRRWHHYHLLSVDAQASAGNGVFVVVFGVLTCDEEEGGGGGGESKKFSQSFFLASFEGTNSNGFFVSSDVFRLLDDQKLEKPSFLVSKQDPPNPSTDSFLGSKQHMDDVDPPPNPSTESFLVSKQDRDDIDPPPNPSTESFLESKQHLSETAPSQKKSFLSVLQSNHAPFASQARPRTPLPARNEAKKEKSNLDRKISMLKEEMRKKQQHGGPVTSPARNNGKASYDHMKYYHGPNKSKRGYSIFVGNLNLNVTPEEVHQEFSKLGKIVDGDRGIRVIKADDPWRRNCYAFVEYEDEVSKQRALQACITIGGKNVIIDEKKGYIDRNSDETKC